MNMRKKATCKRWGENTLNPTSRNVMNSTCNWNEQACAQPHMSPTGARMLMTVDLWKKCQRGNYASVVILFANSLLWLSPFPDPASLTAVSTHGRRENRHCGGVTLKKPKVKFHEYKKTIIMFPNCWVQYPQHFSCFCRKLVVSFSFWKNTNKELIVPFEKCEAFSGLTLYNNYSGKG